METTAQQWIVMEDNEDGTFTMTARFRYGGDFKQATMIIQGDMMETLITAATENPEKMEEFDKITTIVPDSTDDM